MQPRTELYDLPPHLTARFEACGIHDVGGLVGACRTDVGRRRVATMCGLREGVLRRLVAQLDLMRIEGVDGRDVELLEAVGVGTVSDLGRRTVTNLTARIAHESAVGGSSRLAPAAIRVADWVRQARRLKPAV